MKKIIRKIGLWLLGVSGETTLFEFYDEVGKVAKEKGSRYWSAVVKISTHEETPMFQGYYDGGNLTKECSSIQEVCKELRRERVKSKIKDVNI